MFVLSFDLREYQISEAVTELFQKQGQMQELLLRLLSDCASLQTQHFKSDEKFFDSTAMGSGNHQLHRTVQSTDWSRKAQIAGRPVDDLRVHELCFRGFSEFSLRLLSEGRFQSQSVTD